MLGRIKAALLLAAGAAAGAGGPALAADLYAPDPGALRPGFASPVGFAPALPPTVVSWTGAHVGVNVGAALGASAHLAITGNDAARAGAIANGERPAGEGIGRDAVTGGVQLGYDLEVRSLLGFGGAGGLGEAGLLVGDEADIGGVPASGTLRAMSDRASIFASRTDYVGTVRARLGYASGSLLVYATGGFAYGGTADSASFLNPAGRQTYSGSTQSIRTGYAVGAGVEAALSGTLPAMARFGGDVTARLELLRYGLGGSSFLIRNNDGLDSGYTERVRDGGTLLRVGLNYRFGSAVAAPAPVVARY